jgi:hypothetical protein
MITGNIAEEPGARRRKLKLHHRTLSISHVMSTSTPNPTMGSSFFHPLLLLPAIAARCELQTQSSYAMPESDHDSVIPAQLSYLAIYNPTLGPTDETIADQIVFYTSQSSHERENSRLKAEGEEARELENEKLRQIGLAQGLVNFARYAVTQPRR